MPPDILTWILLALLAAVVAGLLLLVRLEKRLAALASASRPAEDLARLTTAVEAIAKAHGELDLRRVEHVLIDLRDGQKRVEDRLLATLETRAEPRSQSSALERSGAALASALPERIVTRLLALGYERIQFVTPLAEIQALSAADGEVLVEARRDGAACKGRVVVRAGSVADLKFQSAYSIFP